MTWISHWFHSDGISFKGADDELSVVGIFDHSILGVHGVDIHSAYNITRRAKLGPRTTLALMCTIPIL